MCLSFSWDIMLRDGSCCQQSCRQRLLHARHSSVCANNSATGTRAWVARVRAEYPGQLDYSGSWEAASRSLASSLAAIACWLSSCTAPAIIELGGHGSPVRFAVCCSLVWPEVPRQRDERGTCCVCGCRDKMLRDNSGFQQSCSQRQLRTRRRSVHAHISATGTRARVARVRAEYPGQLDYSGS